MDELTSAFMKALPELPQDIAFTYKSEIRTILTLKDGSIFPGAQPVSLEPRRGLPDIVINEYLLCEKTDGTRFLLYIPVDFTEPNMALDLTAHTTESEGLALPRTYFLIDREYNFHKTEGLIRLKPLLRALKLPESLISDAYTIPERKKELLTFFNSFTAMFDGEIVGDFSKGTVQDHAPTDKPDQLCYYLFDALFINGTSILNNNLRERLVVANALPEYFTHHEANKFLFKTKTFYEKKDIAELFKLLNLSGRHSRPLLPHHSDGIIFTAVNEAYQSGTCQFIQKWKPLHQNTVDLLLQPVKKKMYVLSPDDYAVLERGATLKRNNEAADNSITESIQQVIRKILRGKPSDRFIGRLFSAVSGLLDSTPVDVISLEEKKYENLDKRSTEIQRENKPGLIIEFFWEQDKEILIYTDVTDYLKESYPELQQLFGSIEVERTRKGAWVGQKYRLDKLLPNDKYVYESVCRAYNDHVNETDLIAILLGTKPLPQGGIVGKISPYLLARVHCPGYD